MKQRVGVAGVGLMGHGIARNILKHGHDLVVLEHPGNQPLDELRRGGASSVTTGSALAAAADVIILCVTGSPEVESVLLGEGGVLSSLRPGTVIVDCSTAVPSSTERVCTAVLAAGGQFIDAPMTRTAQHAHEGRLNLLVGGNSEVVDAVMPLLRCFAENITYAGAVGSGHRLKLIHNFVSLGTIALLSEAAACAHRGGIHPQTLVDVLRDGGGSGVALDRVAPVMLDPAGTPVKFYMANALKDLRYYTTMAAELPTAHEIAESIARTFDAAVERNGPQAYVTDLVSQLS